MTTARPALLWTFAALVAGVELYAASLFLQPNVEPAYRAYYIDHSTDCWPHVTDGAYVLGTPVGFVKGPANTYARNKICGWFYTDDSGTWSYGRYSLLRFAFTPSPGTLTLSVTAGAMVNPAHPAQELAVSANGTALGTMRFTSLTPSAATLAIPAALAATGRIELRFDYPNARPGTELGPNEDSHPRAIRMVSLTLAPAG